MINNKHILSFKLNTNYNSQTVKSKDKHFLLKFSVYALLEIKLYNIKI